MSMRWTFWNRSEKGLLFVSSSLFANWMQGLWFRISSHSIETRRWCHCGEEDRSRECWRCRGHSKRGDVYTSHDFPIIQRVADSFTDLAQVNILKKCDHECIVNYLGCIIDKSNYIGSSNTRLSPTLHNNKTLWVRLFIHLSISRSRISGRRENIPTHKLISK